MKRSGPLLTLLAGLLLGLLTLTLDATAGTRNLSSPAQSPPKIADAPYAGRSDADSSRPGPRRGAVKGSGLYRATATVRGAKADGGWIVLAGVRP
ncbi:hypothetical protein ACFY0B_21895 [Streptomyces sp. NPDC001797]|uniref:hypothetical protein n=1 Tax=Streptomyces sp. NPDC001797 TaxID=3364610 RepID=UPI0036B7FB4C